MIVIVCLFALLFGSLILVFLPYIFVILVVFLSVLAIIPSICILRRLNKNQIEVTAMILLSLALRAENNRYYMEKYIRLRPGYRAQTIEVIFM